MTVVPTVKTIDAEMRKLLPAAELGEKLRALRMAKGFRYGKDFAAHIGRDPAEISRWENGKIQPEYDTVVNLARVLGVPVQEFMQTDEAGPSVAAGQLPYDNAREERDLVAAAKIADPVLRILERESIAAVIRAQAVREAALAWRLAEQNAVTRTDAVREITSGRRDAGERITDADVDEVLTRRQQPEKSRASCE
jgi:transcriptional regulator with XRE-family HTH domain